MSTLLATLRAFWQAARAAGVAEAGPLVIGVSGGPDSLALLHALVRFAPEAGLRLHVAHLDHGLRADASAADAAFVAATCAAWDVPCTVGRADVAAYAAQGGCSLEDAARRVRYTFLAGVAAKVRAGVVAVGHNADDQVETVVAHWLRGAGPAGLAGMAPWAPLPLPPDHAAPAAALGVPVPGAAPWLLRPLLNTWRTEITAYCAEAGLTPREDASNADPAYRRNYLRHNLIPLLEREYPGLRTRLHTSAAIFADEDALLEAHLDRCWPNVADVEGGCVAIRLAPFAALPRALQRRALRRAAALVAGNLQGLDASHIMEALALLGADGRTGAVLQWPGGLTLRRERDRVLVAQAGEAPVDSRWPQLAPGQVCPLPPVGVVELTSYRLLITEHAREDAPAAGSWTAVFDADGLASADGPLVLRTRRPGDRVRPLGLGGHGRKLQDLLVDGGVPQPVRESLALLAQTGGEILWVPGPGGRRADLAPLGPGTRRVRAFTFVPV
jgi:tRNA(Ile)-lysidine synthase